MTQTSKVMFLSTFLYTGCVTTSPVCKKIIEQHKENDAAQCLHRCLNGLFAVPSLQKALKECSYICTGFGLAVEKNHG